MRVLITGGGGFIGRAAARALLERGHAVSLLSSSREGTLDGFPIVRGDVRDRGSLSRAMRDVEAVVIGHQFPGFPVERPKLHQTFHEVDAGGTRNVIDAVKAHGRPRKIVYLSGAAVQENMRGRHPGIDAKLDAEQCARDSGLPWTILRPSIVYGPGDHYFSALAQMAQKGPVVPVFGDGRALSAPIHVEDLAAAIAACLEDNAAENVILDACGPNVLSTNAVLALLMHVLGQKRPVVRIPLPLAYALAGALERLPSPPLSRGLVAFSLFDNTSHGVNADNALGLSFRGVDDGVRQVYGRLAGSEKEAA